MTKVVKKKKKNKLLSGFLKFLRGSFVVVSVLIIGGLIAINTPYVKNKIAQKAIEYLNTTFHTDISAQDVKINFFGNVSIDNLQIKDYKGNSLISTDQAKLYTDFFSIIKDVNDIKVKQLKLSSPTLNIVTYQGEEVSNFDKFLELFKSDKPSDQPFKLAGRLDIEDGQVSIINENLPTSERVLFDAKNINLKATQLNIDGTNILADLNRLALDVKKNNETYQIKGASANIAYTDKAINLKDLFIETNNSLISGDVDLKYNSINDFSDFTNRVKIDLDLKSGSKISGKDLRFAVPNWDNNTTFNIQGKAQGTINNLALSNLHATAGETSLITNSLLLKGITTGNYIIETDKASVSTSYNSLKSIFPSFISGKLPTELEKLGKTSYNGNLQLSSSDVATNGEFVSALGKMKANVMLLGYNSTSPTYSGEIQTENLNISSFVSDPNIGNISGNIKFSGSSFNLDYLKTDFDAHLNQLVINGVQVSPVSIKGNVNDRVFNGDIKSQSPYANFDFNGVVNFASKKILAKFDSNINHLDVAKFIPSYADLQPKLSGKLSSNISFTSIDDIEGLINIDQIKLQTINDSLGVNREYENIALNTTINAEGKREVDLYSPDMLAINMYGNFYLKDLPGMMYNGFGNLLVDYKPTKTYPNENFDFSIDVQGKLFELLLLDVDLSPGTTIVGKYSGETNNIQVQLAANYIRYQDINVNGIGLFLDTEKTENQVQGSIDKLEVANQILSDVNLSAHRETHQLLGNVNLKVGEKALSSLDFNFSQTREGDNVKVQILPSDVKLDFSQWGLNPNLEEGAYFTYNVKNGKMSLDNMLLESQDSRVKLSGEYTSKELFDVDLSLTSVNLDKILTKDLTGGLELAGIADGEVKITRNHTKFAPIVNLDIKGLTLNKKELGNLNLKGVYDGSIRSYLINSIIEKEGIDRLQLAGSIQQGHNGGKPQLNMQLKTNDLELNILEVFLAEVFSNIRGKASGEINIHGDIDAPQYEGALAINDFGLKVNFLGADYYTEKPQLIKVSNGVLDLDKVELIDSKYKTRGTVTGKIRTRNFSRWMLDLNFNSEKLLALSSTAEDNDLFYGTVFTQGDFSIKGPTDNLRISAKAKVLPGSALTINSSSKSVVKEISIFKFIPTSEEQVTATRTNGMEIDATIDADQGSQMTLIIDEQTGDRIEVRGNTKALNFKMSKTGTISMNGKYDISEGRYFFQTLINKEFDIQPGSKISWAGGGPTSADLDIKASYNKTVSNVGKYLDFDNTPNTELSIMAILKGKMASMAPAFKISAPSAPSQIRDALSVKLDNNPDEVLQQSIGILLTGNFIVSKDIAVQNSTYDIFLKQVANVMNNISDKFFFDLSYTPGSVWDMKGDKLKTSVSVDVARRLKLTGATSIPLEQKSASDIWTAEGKAEYDISKSGDKSLTISGFTKPTSFGIQNTVANSDIDQSYGGGIQYRRSFNKLSDIFFNINKKEKRKVKEQESKKNKINTTTDSIKENTVIDTILSPVIEVKDTIRKVESTVGSMFQFK